MSKHVQIRRLDGLLIIRARCTCGPLPHVVEHVVPDNPGALGKFREYRRSIWSYPFPIHVSLQASP